MICFKNTKNFTKMINYKKKQNLIPRCLVYLNVFLE